MASDREIDDKCCMIDGLLTMSCRGAVASDKEVVVDVDDGCCCRIIDVAYDDDCCFLGINLLSDPQYRCRG